MREKSELNSQANHPTNVAEKIDLNFANIKLEELSLDEVKMIIYEQQVKQNELEKIKTKYFNIYDYAPVGYLILSEKGLIVESNLTAANMIGLSRQILIKERLSQYIFKEDRNIYHKHRRQLFDTMKSQECELRMVKTNGSIFWVELKATVEIEGQVPFCGLVLSDISKRKKIEAQLQQNMKDLLASQRIAHLGTWRMNVITGKIVWSEELYKIFGHEPTKPPPAYEDHLKLFVPESWEKLSAAMEEIMATGRSYELELETIKRDGSKGWAWIRGEAEKNQKGKIVSLWGIAQDISEHKQNEEQLLYLSNHDHLTGLHNRRYYERKLKYLDSKENLPLSVIMFDVNGLKLVNDSFGHDLGDVLIKKTADTIKKVCRKNDLVARIGGDEFVLVLPKTSLDESKKIANHIKKITSKEIVSNIALSISYGCDTKEMSSQLISAVCANAENVMYKHKLNERLSIRSKTIELIMNSLFDKSQAEKQHSNKVSQICFAIASKMQLDEETVKKLRAVGLIHDIGKIGINERILNKTDSLTNSERIDIERHSEIGWRLLSSTNEFSELAQLVIDHHEKMDGSGYPNGLKGKAIQLESRILAIAEAYDAMTSKKSYRKELTKEEAIKELKKCSGTHFDAEIVNVFVEQVLAEHEEF
jgi:diguanylate cyclase (GGDEF)-like protein/PAS domain S-box-containing protein/putative nucleotidyltransferase with HDIG domain